MRTGISSSSGTEEASRKSDDHLSFVLFDDAGDVHRITKEKLLVGAARCAGYLQGKGISPSQHVLLVLPHSVELLYWLFGCFMAQVIPSILAGPSRGGGEKGNWERIRRAALLVNATAAVAVPEWKNGLGLELKGTGCQVLLTDSEWTDACVNETQHFQEMNIPGYVQFTSGTTGISKAVVLSGKAINAYVRNMAEELAVKPDDTVVSCLPLSHDFALFGGVLMPFTAGIPAVLISPSRWVRRPATLLRAIHDYDGTISWIPNSGFVHCARFVQDREMAGINLSKLRVIINGAEPILHSSNQLFLRRFSAYGFEESALASGYGMAENTLGATLSVPGKRAPVVFVHGPELAKKKIAKIVPKESPAAVPVVSCGQSLKGTEIQIVDSEGCSLPDAHVGEILIRSMSLFSEYAGDEVLTKKVLVGGWFHTGDLGFRIGENLFFAGRIKDLIIVGGRNISPVELEKAAAEIPGVRHGQVVAFGVQEESIGTERIVLVCTVRAGEFSGTKYDMARMIRQHVAKKTGVAISDVKLVRKGWIEKTANGKLARAKNREKYLMAGGVRENG